MGTLIFAATVVLVIMGFNNSILWLAAAGLLYVYFRYGRTGSGAATSSSGPGTGAGAGTTGSSPASYRAYRQRRDQQARWERRYRRERPLQSRRGK
ncbi:hypothetical protein [Streptomyces geranii]|uniref:hypothetical protein n=1 Tax=Streptomyces geranii TaxID=2058923 RepID=UPI000D041C04|nr:hypothetical protein [Streptomyces geranii]